MRHTQIRAFHHVAQSGGFSRAAQALNLSQPAVSDQVRKLERDHDVLLFRREHKQVHLTEAGERLYALTRQLFDIDDQITACLSETRAQARGALRLVVDAAHHVTGVLGRFRAAYPGVTISLRTGNTAHVLAALRDYTADIGVIGAETGDRDLDTLMLGRSPIIGFATRAFAQDLPRPMRLADFAALPLVIREEGSKTRAFIEAEAARLGIVLRPTIVAEGREAVRDVVIAGAGVGFISEAEFSAGAALVPLPIADSRAMMSETLVCLGQRREVRLIRAFMEIARA